MQMRICSSSAAVRVTGKAPRVRGAVAVRRVERVQLRDTRAFFFNFGKKGQEEASQASRSDYGADDVEHYFNYMGCLAEEGTYDRMEELMGSGLEPVDVILLLAAAENDDPKIEELLAAGADVGARDGKGRTPRQLATKDVVIRMLDEAEAKKVKV
ncbi:hypothetical protein Rsub_01722 [Raphidocelis subcapitata]|uniref:Uncharacterized protein n=1 Tax=Raphidocelis subcapitata TaxID=307507 RepID=A0A2V0NMR5_9CHLO|nr:hypothetical protein Rsub_01722 [Raphidocelis subcapitata]|eukprot:GBF88821.1 hypothetical protein Rsub_01722 [Raphidocelis subcapitata]